MSKRNTFYGAAAILTVSTILVKIIGAIFKIPLIAILPEEAYGDFNGAYNIYSFFLTISTAGLPVALSKTVSECHTLGRENQKRQVFRMAFGAFLFMGLFSFICMSLFGQIVATYVIGNEKAVFCVWALAPAVLCTCCCSAFRGYAQGHMNMLPTAISQIIEALCKLVLGLGLAMLIMRLTIWPDDIRNQLAASGALIGVSFGSILSVLYLAFNHVRTRRRESTPATDRADRGRTVLVRLLKLAIPITLSSCSMSLVTIIDTNLVNNQLQSVFTAIQGGLAGIENSFLDIFPKAVQVFADNVAAQQADLFSQLMTSFREGTAAADFGTTLDPILDSARSLYGTYSKTMSVYNLPFNLMIPLTACIVPGISACLARRDGLGAQRITAKGGRLGFSAADHTDSACAPVWAMFDNEEVGSGTRQGAASLFLRDVLDRVYDAIPHSAQGMQRALANSFVLSADNAHATHPNFGDKADPANPVRLGGGLVLKINASQKYTTNALSGAVVREICRLADVKVQQFANRADLPGGSTLGNLQSHTLPVPMADIGLAQLGMHSAVETAAVSDAQAMVRAVDAFYRTHLRCLGDGQYTLEAAQ